MTKVLFVCLSNICRSPAAEGILKTLAEREELGDQVAVESCGIGDWCLGDLPDARMRLAAQARGVILAGRAKKFQADYLDEFDYIFAADNEILEHLHRFAKGPQHKAKIHLMTVFGSAHRGKSIPDPFYGGDAAFENILDMLEDACEGIIQEIKSNLQ